MLTSFVWVTLNTLVMLDFSWSAPSECALEAEVRARVERTRPPHALPLTVRARVLSSDDGYQLLVNTTSSNGRVGSRELRVQTCATAADAAVSLLALAWETPAAPSVASAPSRARWDLGLNGALEPFLLPHPAGGFSALVRWTQPPFSLTLSPGFLVPVRQRAGQGSTAAVEYAVGEMTVSGCVEREWFNRTWVGSGCVASRAGFVAVSSFGVSNPRGGVAGLFGAGLAVAMQTRLGDWWLGGSVEVMAQLLRPSFAFQNEAPVHRVPLLSVRPQLTVGWRWP